MGSEHFARKVFTKVFKDDIERLRGMEDMWKSRKPPEPLDYSKLQEKAGAIDPTVSRNDQKVWTLEEDFVVFKDRSDIPECGDVLYVTDADYSLDRLSKRLKSLQDSKTGNIEPILTFDKDDVDTLDFVAASANLRSTIFGIESRSKFDIKRMCNLSLLSI
jgi:ubiquitin-like 1-activating enzyme E1 B